MLGVDIGLKDDQCKFLWNFQSDRITSSQDDRPSNWEQEDEIRDGCSVNIREVP